MTTSCARRVAYFDDFGGDEVDEQDKNCPRENKERQGEDENENEWRGNHAHGHPTTVRDSYKISVRTCFTYTSSSATHQLVLNYRQSQRHLWGKRPYGLIRWRLPSSKRALLIYLHTVCYRVVQKFRRFGP